MAASEVLQHGGTEHEGMLLLLLLLLLFLLLYYQEELSCEKRHECPAETTYSYGYLLLLPPT